MLDPVHMSRPPRWLACASTGITCDRARLAAPRRFPGEPAAAGMMIDARGDEGRAAASRYGGKSRPTRPGAHHAVTHAHRRAGHVILLCIALSA
eukprot:4316453-Pleurochrysis_carterae.AAC.4